MNYAKALAMCGATLIAAAAIATTATPVHARTQRPVTVVASPSEYLTRRVSYADLDLAAKPDLRVLHQRVGYAVNDVCNEVMGEPSTQFTMQECTKDSWSRAQPQIYRAVQRARQIAATGTSSIAAAAIIIGD